MSIDFVIRTKLDNKGIVQAENELRKLFDEGAKMYAKGTLPSVPAGGLFDPAQIQQGNQAIQQSIELIRQAREEAKNAARIAAGTGDLTRAAGLEKVAQGYNQQLSMLNRLKPAQQQFASLQDVINRNADKFRGAESLKDYQQGLKQVSAALKEQAALQLRQGNMLGFEDSQKAINQVQSFTNSLKNLSEEGEKTSGIAGIMNSKFNQFGFTLFVTISTIRQLIDIAKQMFDTFLDGAQVADRVQSFAFALERAGYSASEMRANLQEAGQGIVDIDTAMKGTIQLLKSGLPEAADQADELLKIATNAAIVSGEVEKADEIYQKLIRGIVRASPRLIDDADILLKLGDAYGEFAKQNNIVGRELTVVEQKMATLNAVLEEGKRIGELAEGIDSVAQPLKSLETGLKETTDNLKLFFGVIASEGVTTLGTFTSGVRDGLIATLESLGVISSSAAERVRRDWGTFGDFFATLLASLGAFFGGFVELIVGGARLIGVTLQEVQRSIEIVGAVAKGQIDSAQATEMLKDSLGRATIAWAEYESSARTGGHMQERFNEWMERFGLSTSKTSKEVQGLTQDLEELRKQQQQEQMGNQLSGIEKALEAAIEARTGIEAQRSEKLVDAREDLAEKLADIEENLGDRLTDIKKSYNDRLIKISQDYKERAADIAKNTAKELAEIDEDLAKELAENRNQAVEDRAKAEMDQNKALEEIAEDHQKKLAEIERKYQLSRMKALIDRDARALFEAEQQRKSDIEEAIEDAEGQKKDEVEQYLEKIEEIKKEEEKQRRELIKNAEERRADALKAQAEQLADLKANYIKQRLEAKKAYNEQRRDAIDSAKEQRQDAQKAYREKLRDIAEWYQDQLAAQKERQLKEKISELKHLNEMGELTQSHLNELKSMYGEYNKFVASGGQSGGDISYNPGGGGGNITPGVGVIGGGQATPPGSNVTPGGGLYQYPIPGAWKQQVDITVNGDQTLAQIFKEISYEATMEVIGD